MPPRLSYESNEREKSREKSTEKKQRGSIRVDKQESSFLSHLNEQKSIGQDEGIEIVLNKRFIVKLKNKSKKAKVGLYLGHDSMSGQGVVIPSNNL